MNMMMKLGTNLMMHDGIDAIMKERTISWKWDEVGYFLDTWRWYYIEYEGWYYLDTNMKMRDGTPLTTKDDTSMKMKDDGEY